MAEAEGVADAVTEGSTPAGSDLVGVAEFEGDGSADAAAPVHTMAEGPVGESWHARGSTFVVTTAPVQPALMYIVVMKDELRGRGSGAGKRRWRRDGGRGASACSVQRAARCGRKHRRGAGTGTRGARRQSLAREWARGSR